MKKEYTTISKTTVRGRSDLCWVDIDVNKLKDAAEKNETFFFECIINGICYKYHRKANFLLKYFREKNVKIKHNEHNGAYSFYLGYESGKIYRTTSKKDVTAVCSLKKGGKLLQLDGTLRLYSNFDALHVLGRLIAQTAIWVPKEMHDSCKNGNCYAANSNVKRGKGKIRSGFDPRYPDVRLDSNCYPKSQMVSALKSVYKLTVKNYHLCHIWKDTCHDPRYHTCYANLVMLPSALASLTDYDDWVQDVLKYRAWELYGWHPEESSRPKKPKNYPKDWAYPIPKQKKTKKEK